MGWYSSVPSSATLDCWIKNSYNVLFHGRHGIGKTAMIKNAFHKNGWEMGIDYLYFSAATIDPWVDLIGVPSKSINEDGEEIIKLIRPENVKNTIKAFFVDELNRSHMKVRNAMMELIQFKSINGRKFPNLQVVWGAVNPDDDADLKFDVQKLDPAQEDRFEIHVQIPYKPCEAFFAERFNDPEMAESVCKWWNEQTDKIKLEVTPRRLEYAIDVFQNTGDLRFVIPNEVSASTLKNAIQSGNPEKVFRKILETGKEEECRRWIAIENNLTSVQNLICTDKNIAEKALPLLSDERLTSFAAKHKVVQDQMKNDPKKYAKVIKDLAENSTQKMLKEMCKKLLPLTENSNESLSKTNLTYNIPTKGLHNLEITKRRKSEIFSNYGIDTRDDVLTNTTVPSSIVNRKEYFLSIISACSFATTSDHIKEILKNLDNVVTNDMNQSESFAALEIAEFVSSYSVKDDINYIIESHLPTMNAIVVSWSKHVKEVKPSVLFSKSPYLTTRILSVAADNIENSKYANSKLAFVKERTSSFEHISEEIEFQKKSNSLEGLF